VACESEPPGIGFHINQPLITVGTGGITQALVLSKQKLFYRRAAHFIYAITAEELGLIGAVLIATLFFIFAWRGLRTSLRAIPLAGTSTSQQCPSGSALLAGFHPRIRTGSVTGDHGNPHTVPVSAWGSSPR
jgi:cell division protein FtsW